MLLKISSMNSSFIIEFTSIKILCYAHADKRFC